MIAYLKGELFHKSAERVVVLVGGVGYEASLSRTSLESLADMGQEVFLHIYTHVREDALQLFGFLELFEKEMFLLLIGVSGVGPKLALAILSGMRPQDLGRAIGSGDVLRLTKIAGVGKKTAERLCLELKDKVQMILAASPFAGGGPAEISREDARILDVISALANLGYSQVQARDAILSVRRTMAEEAFAALRLEELLRLSLRALV